MEWTANFVFGNSGTYTTSTWWVHVSLADVHPLLIVNQGFLWSIEHIPGDYFAAE